MITAVDTNVLLDLLATGSAFGDASEQALVEACGAGGLVVSEIVYAELGAAFRGDRERLDEFLEDAGIDLVRSPRTVFSEAGRMWRAYRDQGGSRERIVADFLIGAHAHKTSDRLLTRDRGFFRKWFQDLEVVDPSSGD